MPMNMWGPSKETRAPVFVNAIEFHDGIGAQNSLDGVGGPAGHLGVGVEDLSFALKALASRQYSHGAAQVQNEDDGEASANPDDGSPASLSGLRGQAPRHGLARMQVADRPHGNPIGRAQQFDRDITIIRHAG